MTVKEDCQRRENVARKAADAAYGIIACGSDGSFPEMGFIAGRAAELLKTILNNANVPFKQSQDTSQDRPTR